MTYDCVYKSYVCPCCFLYKTASTTHYETDYLWIYYIKQCDGYAEISVHRSHFLFVLAFPSELRKTSRIYVFSVVYVGYIKRWVIKGAYVLHLRLFIQLSKRPDLSNCRNGQIGFDCFNQSNDIGNQPDAIKTRNRKRNV